jgi:hypothetical protein
VFSHPPLVISEDPTPTLELQESVTASSGRNRPFTEISSSVPLVTRAVVTGPILHAKLLRIEDVFRAAVKFRARLVAIRARNYSTNASKKPSILLANI